MGFWHAVARTNFFIKLKSWEYWPFGIVQLPAIVYYLWLSLRARSFLFFSASNPGIPMGGMFGESKFDILKKIPDRYTPKTLFVKIPSTSKDIAAMLRDNNFQLPVIFKPDLGERGNLVKRINSLAEIELYLTRIKIDFIIQEFIDLPMEFGIFYTCFPDKTNGIVTSVTMKEMLYVQGDGKSTLRELIFQKDRAKLQWTSLKKMHLDKLNTIFAKNEIIELVSIGNHCLGTKFIDANHLINERLSETFDTISKQIPGFYFGRFDLRCATLEDLYDGRVKIMELNGCGAEPAHVYNPGYSFYKAVCTFCLHWRNIFIIARENNKKGVPYTTASEALKYYKTFRASQRTT